MPHALTELKLTAVTKPVHAPDHDVHTDVCVVGDGIAGLSAAIESARLGRDGDAAALSSGRVMGPCAAMGAGAAHALDLAGSGSTHDVDPDQLHERLAPTLD